MENTYNLVATTMFGLEPILTQELQKIGAKKIVKGNRSVSFQGDKRLIYLANLKLRTALKILKTIKIFKAYKEEDIYRNVSKIKWYKIFNVSKTFSISSTVNSKYFKHSKYVSLIIKDAIVDQFRKYKNKRPSINIKSPDISIHIHISDYNCSISLNSSGHSLHKRGYRVGKFKAPINEVLAAGIVMLSNWDLKTKLLDPMCGSGTILIEAGLIAMNRAPNIYRGFFNFQQWKDYDKTLFENIKAQLIKEERVINSKIHGYDISSNAISVARKNIAKMKLHHHIKINKEDFLQTQGEENIILIFNPPYGKRIDLRENYYKIIGDKLKQNYTNTYAWIISSEFKEIKQIGLKTTEKIKLFNGALECKLLKYELYQGSKKTNRPQNV